jgi:hypothetical protein
METNRDRQCLCVPLVFLFWVSKICGPFQGRAYKTDGKWDTEADTPDSRESIVLPKDQQGVWEGHLVAQRFVTLERNEIVNRLRIMLRSSIRYFVLVGRLRSGPISLLVANDLLGLKHFCRFAKLVDRERI